ncbi:cobyric acid synthase CobQ [Leptolyngbyaceae cyanobacterium CCMR0082]|uniref:Cobyric acid synthase n=2 Tax=Adonisia turfae TaxID=2950184 RepID=A0A6M0S631_9CYAN|nr:cobyric acid synthase CobQ [Adonisia turfae]MDV3350596.1 cobyric acid synthase CobQ [Leptothoe sp. LEGE 181152]NEZ55144.1 cobyric acid synthase CobQ [Adonisia turfae CCMR0081]NEZ63441.1 cobyric acid synthase CobQ [Adonisia turfae CCMR0082]
MKAIMVVGTTSHAGKSLLVTALCRMLSRRGWRVAPFKGHNTAPNTYVTANGAEIGYPQAVQAWAAGVSPQAEMNPVLLKPQNGQASQVIIKGRPVGQTTPTHYYETYFETGWQAVQESLARLGQEFDLLICEGDGNPAEINIKQRDLANMRVAKALKAPTILVTDIDRGGAFAHIVGTLELLEPDERELVKGIVINKFRGQKSLLQPGIDWIEKRTGIPVLGVIPWIESASPRENSVSLMDRPVEKQSAELNIAVIRLPRISNFTDFDPLEAEPSVNVRYLSPKDDLGHPDAVILPGTKTAIADLLILQRTGMAEAIQNYAAAGGTVLGICGGFQLMGQMLADPEGLEGQEGRFRGLSILPLRTVITQNKVARQRSVSSKYPQEGLPVNGYEIHHGRTQLVMTPEGGEPGPKFQPIFDDRSLGIVDETESLWGTYLHGIFDNGPWRRAWLNRLRQQRGLGSLPTGIANYRDQRDSTLNELANTVEQYINLEPILNQS